MLFKGRRQTADQLHFRSVSTPAGLLRLDVDISEALTCEEESDAVYHLGNCLLFTLDREYAEIGLLVGDVKPELPEGGKIVGSRAALWRIQARHAIDDLAFSCRWRDAPRLRPGRPCSGQGLDAQEWSDGLTRVTVGTQNLWSLMSFRGRGSMFPDRWMTASWSTDPDALGFTEYLHDGLVLHPPSLNAGEMLQVQFVIAWTTEPDARSSTWFAVDLTPSEILQEFGQS